VLGVTLESGTSSRNSWPLTCPVPPRRCALFAKMIAKLVADHDQQQLDQLLAIPRFELSGSHAEKKIPQHGLADIARIQESSQARVGQTDANETTDFGLVLSHELGRRLFGSCFDPADEVGEGSVFDHRVTPSTSGNCDSGRFLTLF